MVVRAGRQKGFNQEDGEGFHPQVRRGGLEGGTQNEIRAWLGTRLLDSLDRLLCLLNGVELGQEQGQAVGA